MNRLLTTGALALTAAGLLASSAQAAGPNTCVYNPSSKNVNVKLNSGSFIESTARATSSSPSTRFGKTVCTSTTGVIATVNNTGAIFMNGSLSAPKEDFIVNYSGGEFLPGAKTTSGDQNRVEVVVFADQSDIVDVAGTPGRTSSRSWVGSDTTTFGGVRVNGDLNSPAPSIKLPFGNPSLLRINGLGGSDFITGNGVFGTATTMHLRLTGGEGNDSLGSGLIAGDVLLGEAGDDSFDTKQGQRGDISNGGAGNDTASIDAPGDSAFEVESPSTARSACRAASTRRSKGRTSTVNAELGPPAGLEAAGQGELGAFVGAERVGTVTMTPATGKITARGALSLTARREARPQGQDRLRGARARGRQAVDTDNLHFRLSATDKAGDTQTDRVPGVLWPPTRS